MYDLTKLSQILGMKEQEVYTRIYKFRALLKDHIRRGKKNKILLENNGLEILKRIKELEQEGNTFKTIQNLIEEELKSKDDVDSHSSERDKTEEEADKDLLDLLREQIVFLQRQIEYLQQENRNLLRVIENRLPPAKEFSPKLGLFQRIKVLFSGKLP